MTLPALKASLSLWQRRELYRRRKHDKAVKHHDEKARKKWLPLLGEAKRMVDRRQSQVVMRIPLREKALAVAQTLVGVMEQGGNNTGPMVDKIIHANGGDIGEPWCGDTVAFCYRQAGAKTVERFWASVAMLGSLSRVRNPKPGHIVRYTFDHTGLFVRDLGNGQIETIEGNTGPVGAVSDSATGGDGVYVKHRDKSLVRDYRRVLR